MSVFPMSSGTRVRRNMRGLFDPPVYKYGTVLGMNIFGQAQHVYYQVLWDDGDIREDCFVEAIPEAA